MKSRTILVMVAVLSLLTTQALSWTQFNDGGVHDISTEIADDVWVDWEAPGMGTTVNVIEGGAITGGYELHGYNDSQINVAGGSVGNNLYAYDSSTVTLSSGSIGKQISSKERACAPKADTSPVNATKLSLSTHTTQDTASLPSRLS